MLYTAHCNVLSRGKATIAYLEIRAAWSIHGTATLATVFGT